MTELNAPLFSLHAHGSIAHSLSFQRSAGRNRALDYSFPTGELSVAQVLHRARYSTAAATWSATHPTTGDLSALLRLARQSSRTWSPFNVFLHLALPLAADGVAWQMLTQITSNPGGPNLFGAWLGDYTVPATPVVHWGVTPYLFPSSLAMNLQAGVRWWANPGGLDPLTTYYWYITFEDPGVTYGRSGIYAHTTSA